MLPKLLIIGAMKSGTTSLYDDLRQHPDIFFPHDKEPHFLCRSDALEGNAVDEYRRLFTHARQNQICVDASTGYTKMPTYTGVAHRAVKLLGDEIQSIYILRHPVKRAISHYHHEFVHGRITQDIDTALREQPEFIYYSSYAYQVQPWLEKLGRNQVLLLKFEDFILNRQSTYNHICQWMGLKRFQLRKPNRRINASINKPLLKGPWKTIASSSTYRKKIRPLLPTAVVRKLQHMLLPKGPSKLPYPNNETLSFLAMKLREDAMEMSHMMESDDCLWDLDMLCCNNQK